MIITPLSSSLAYEYLHKTYRLLHHQTLDSLLRYPEIPRKTTNFDMYPINKLRHKHTITLGGAVTTVHNKTISDSIVTETWTADDISMNAGFFYELLLFYNTALDTGDHLIWYPKDKTEKAFSIQPIDLVVGDSTAMAVHPVHPVLNWDYRFIISDVVFSFVIRRVYEVPEAIALLEGT